MSTQEVQSPKEVIKSTINELREKQIYAGFPIGKKIPNFETRDTHNNQVKVYDFFDKSIQFLIINFFRGDWCGYCKDELLALQDNYNKLQDLGAEVISIAPQNIDELKQMKKERDLEFPVLADPDLSVAELFNITWNVPKNLRQIYLDEFDLDIPRLNANNSWILPIPATYIVNKNGDVISKFEDLNYAKRMDIEEIISILENIN